MSSGPPVYVPTDHIAAMKANLVSQFQGLPNLGALIKALGCQLNDVDEFYGQIFTLLNLQQATAAQLDALGNRLNQSRNNLTDDAYRTLLQARINSYRSQGTIEDMIQTLMTLTGASSVQLLEGQTAAMRVTVVGETPPELTNADVVTAAYQAKGAGVHLDLYQTPVLPAFKFDLPAATAEYAGFDQGHLSSPFP